MTTRETIAWALATGLAVVLGAAALEIRDLSESVEPVIARAVACEADQAECLENLDLCGQVLTEVTAKCWGPAEP